MTEELDRYICPACSRIYPLVMGIPSFCNNSLDAAEASLINHLISVYDNSSFEEMALGRLNAYRLSEKQRQSFTRYTLTLNERGIRFHRMFQRKIQERSWATPGRRMAVEIGCGMGAGLGALAQEFEHVVGVDIKLSSLIIARKLLESAYIRNVTLIHASAFSLPFADGTFDHARAINVLEHVFLPADVLIEIRRVLVETGIFCGDSRNRFDLLFPEPHVQLRWVGFLPRKWMARYVRWRVGDAYDHTYLLSFVELRRALTVAFSNQWQVALPEAETYGFSPRLGRIVDLAGRIPVLSSVLIFFAPTHIVLARRITREPGLLGSASRSAVDTRGWNDD